MLGISSQESEWACICVLGISSQESELSCIFVLGLSNLLVFRIVLTVVF